jgi:holo-[acyl-carrier protein] synthase
LRIIRTLAACVPLNILEMRSLPVLPAFPSLASALGEAGQKKLKVGMDLVQISRMGASVEKFGQRFMQRIFTPHELAYALSAPGLRNERLAARFAAKEAALKALALADKGVAWQDMEVVRLDDGQCELQLHGKAEALSRANGVVQTSLSLTHDGDYAAAIVAAVYAEAPAPTH